MTAPRLAWVTVSLGVLACLLFLALFAANERTEDRAGHRTEQLVTTATPVYSGDFPDPSIMVRGDRYYAYSTQSGTRNIQVMASSDLMHWSHVRDALPRLPIWAARGFTWAPTVARTETGEYVMFYAAYDPTLQVECIGRATSSSPLGPFVDPSRDPFLCQPSLGGSIDPYIFTDDDRATYLLWKSNGGNGTTQSIWSQVLNPSYASLLGSPSLLIGASSTWEGGTVEGPAMLRTSEGLYLFFSGNRWSTSSYAIGMVGCDTPIGPCVTRSNGPIVSTLSNAAGPGGPSFFMDDEGQELMAYAAWWNDDGRIHARRALFLDQVDTTGPFPSVLVWQR